jgi:hypothetical protein
MKITKKQKIRILELIESFNNGIIALQHNSYSIPNYGTSIMNCILKNKEELDILKNKKLYKLTEKGFLIFNDGQRFKIL